MPNRIVRLSTPYEIEHIAYRKQKAAVDRFIASAECEVEVADPADFLPLFEYPGKADRQGIPQYLAETYTYLDASKSSKAIVRDGSVYYPFTLNPDGAIEWRSTTQAKPEILPSDLTDTITAPYQPGLSRMVFRDGIDDATNDLHRMAADMVFVGDDLYVKRNAPCLIFNPGPRQSGNRVWVYDFDHAINKQRGAFVAALPAAEAERLACEVLAPDARLRCNLPWSEADHLEAVKLTIHEIVQAARNEFENHVAAIAKSTTSWRIDVDSRSNYASLANVNALRSQIASIPDAIQALVAIDEEFRNAEWSCISDHWRALIPASLAESAHALGARTTPREVTISPVMTITCRDDRIIDDEGVAIEFFTTDDGVLARKEFSRLNDDRPWWFSFGGDHLHVSEAAVGARDEDGQAIFLVEDPFVTVYSNTQVEFTTSTLINPIKPRVPALVLAFCGDIFAEEMDGAALGTIFTCDTSYLDLPATLRARMLEHLAGCMIEAATIAATDSSDKAMRMHPGLADIHRVKRAIQNDADLASAPETIERLTEALAGLERDVPKIQNALDLCRFYQRIGERVSALENDLSFAVPLQAQAPGL